MFYGYTIMGNKSYIENYLKADLKEYNNGVLQQIRDFQSFIQEILQENEI